MSKMRVQQHYDFFISGRWRNRDNVLDLTNKVRKKGYKVYCFLETEINQAGIYKEPEAVMESFEQRDWKEDKLVRQIFESDMLAQKNSDSFIMLLPAGKSCHVEAGVAYGLGKKCILIGEQKEAESLYLIFDEVYPTVDGFLKTI